MKPKPSMKKSPVKPSAERVVKDIRRQTRRHFSAEDKIRIVLDGLREVFAEGFAHLTMGEIASATQCSLRTLYDLAPSKNDLVRLMVDRQLWGIGRRAMAAIEPDMAPLDSIRMYLRAAHIAVVDTTESFAADASADSGTNAIQRSHADYLIDVTRALLDEAVERGDIANVDTAAVARVMANVGADFASPTVLRTLRTSPKAAADTIVDLMIQGLTTRSTEGTF